MPSTLDQSHCLQAASHLLKLLDAGRTTICWLLQGSGPDLDSHNEQRLLVGTVKVRDRILQKRASAQRQLSRPRLAAATIPPPRGKQKGPAVQRLAASAV